MTLREEIMDLSEEMTSKNLKDICHKLFEKHFADFLDKYEDGYGYEWSDFFTSTNNEFADKWEKECRAVGRKYNKVKEVESIIKGWYDSAQNW